MKIKKIKMAVICSALFSSLAIAQSAKEEWPVPAEANKLENPLGTLQPNEASKKIYQSYCMPCHGDKGVGDGACGISLDPRPYNLTIKKVENETDGSLFWRISNGHLSMPTFSGSLTEMQRWQMVIYIRYLQQQADEEKAAKANKKNKK
jgi:mono/diheme cytochrome c family protein